MTTTITMTVGDDDDNDNDGDNAEQRSYGDEDESVCFRLILQVQEFLVIDVAFAVVLFLLSLCL